MKLFKDLIKTFLLMIPIVIFIGSCGEESAEEVALPGGSLPGGSTGSGTASQMITMAGTLVLPSLTLAVSDYTWYCVTFEATPKATSDQLNASGEFSVDVWTGVNFGCFVNDANNQPIATVVIEGDSTDLGKSTTAGIALSSSVNLGSLAISDAGTVVIPAATIASAQTSASSQINVDDLHAKGYTLSCSASGNAKADEDCASLVSESPTVFFRVLKATEDGASIEGVGIWASEADFTACGSIDFATNEISGVTFSQGDAGTYSDSGCSKRSDGTPQQRYTIGKITASGLGYSFHDEDSFEKAGDCTQHEVVSIDFSGTATTMFGLFNMTTSYKGICSGISKEEQGARVFTLNFTQT
jgi:hypothetical protein